MIVYKLFSKIFKRSVKQEKEYSAVASARKQNNGKVVAFSLSCSDLDYMYPDMKSMPGVCPVCHCTLEKIPDLAFRVSMQRDIGCTYDGFQIVSDRFKQFCEEQKYSGLEFLALPNSPGFYVLRVLDNFCADKNQTTIQYSGKHDCCGHSDWLGRVNLVCHEDLSPDANFIQSFLYLCGDDCRKFSLLVVGVETAKRMRAYGLKGMSFHRDVYYYGKKDVAYNDLQERIWRWLTMCFAQTKIPNSVIAFHLGIYSSKRGYELYLDGCSDYNELTDDWCCSDVFQPKERTIEIQDISIKNLVHDNFQQDIVSIMRGYISNYESPLTNRIVVVGFDDGELTRVQ